MNESVLPRGDHSPPCGMSGPALHESSRIATGCCPASSASRSARSCCGSASELFAVSRARARGGPLRLKACAVLLSGFGLWWPGHFLAPLDAAQRPRHAPFARRRARLGPGRARVLSPPSRRRARRSPAFAGLAVGHAAGRLRRTRCSRPRACSARPCAFGAWGPGIAVFVLATTLVGLGLEFKPSRKLRALRIGGAPALRHCC